MCVCLSYDYGYTPLSTVVNFGNQYSVQMQSDVCLRVFTQDGGCFVGLFTSNGRRGRFIDHKNTIRYNSDLWHWFSLAFYNCTVNPHFTLWKELCSSLWTVVTPEWIRFCKPKLQG